MVKKILKILFKSLLIFVAVVVLLISTVFIYVLFNSEVDPPITNELKVGVRKKIGENHFVLGNNYLKKNQFGIWEMYLEGEPYERGLIYGELGKELIQKQEDIFVAQINQFVPPGFWQKLLKLIIGFFNSDLPNYISLESQQEIYGISKSFSDKYDFIASKYIRILNYHAAHDIGHALNDYSLVGCTSFSLKGEKTIDKKMVIGRNFDFYVGDEFAEDKIIVFVNPSSGFKFASYSWAGFTGVASGMNEKGLSVTINASKSDLPTGSKMPISLLAREILQYASTIDEAISIAKKRNTFVSETIMIGSAIDGKTILIEKSPNKMGIHDPKKDELICSNHYQSREFNSDVINITNIEESDSKYRYLRVKKLLGEEVKFDLEKVVEVLRDQYTENGDTLGMGNPRAINQLIAHHSVVLIPEDVKMYISTSDYQLGQFIGFDLARSFSERKGIITDTISASPFIKTEAYKKFKEFKKIKQQIFNFLTFNYSCELDDSKLNYFISLNGESYVTYEMLGKYFQKKGNKQLASKYFILALSKNIASKKTQQEIENLYQACRQD